MMTAEYEVSSASNCAAHVRYFAETSRFMHLGGTDSEASVKGLTMNA